MSRFALQELSLIDLTTFIILASNLVSYTIAPYFDWLIEWEEEE